mmetsp:Transcript_20874/g.30573  ORF Transcript_20874/g.30573 Transcript_20874/m.30573 type:complete len:155 (-) Transcript_20874:123-587(-)|eukprot:CAMPEP_0197245468 /NCGR_PEP_ID=MMETSP1429-20130617/10243_1 /TAXON_ID=49237 /ORGANISM="Chaetoceros  sp., Strain UNC1202" /LENGTH=154 /DNA_ID=CAMNT_0042705965 /DNA_START=401 /DNA_END=865 /DNA_ORIENTATION=-
MHSESSLGVGAGTGADVIWVGAFVVWVGAFVGEDEVGTATGDESGAPVGLRFGADDVGSLTGTAVGGLVTGARVGGLVTGAGVVVDTGLLVGGKVEPSLLHLSTSGSFPRSPQPLPSNAHPLLHVWDDGLYVSTAPLGCDPGSTPDADTSFMVV